MQITIRTNNVPRPLLSGCDLTDKERKEFGYIDDMDETTDRFFRYKGSVYDTQEFSRIIVPGSVRHHPMECAEPAFQDWQGYCSDSFFSGVLIKYCNNFECIIVARYFS